MKKWQIVLLTGLPFVSDQLIKAVILQNNLYYTVNTGFIFGSFRENNAVAIILNVIIISFLFIICFTGKYSKFEKVLYAFVIGASVSNLFDRFVYHGVVDYIKVWKIPSFNISDIIIVSSLGGIVLGGLKSDSTQS